MKRAVIFDVDGTLLDTSVPILRSVNAALASMEFPQIEWEKCVEFVGHGLEYLARGVGPKDISQQQSDELVERYRAHHSVHFGDGAKPYPGMYEAVKELKALGFEMGVLSNKPQAFAEKIVAEQFGENTFQAVLGKEKDTPSKPQAQSVYWVCEKLGIHPKNAVLIGDSSVDQKTALNAQIPYILVNWGFTHWQPQENVTLAEQPCDLVNLICKTLPN